jgi:hypothetical protein
MDLAREMAADIGVDRLCWEITDHPEDAFSRRFAPGTADFQTIKRETWDDSNLGNAIPGSTPRARIDVRTLLPSMPVIAPRRRAISVRTRVHNLSTRPFPATATYGRRLVRLGAQLCSAEGTLINLDFARASLPSHLAPGSSVDIKLRLPAFRQPGRYLLKFDLVNEGVDWFERCGSETTIRPFYVV